MSNISCILYPPTLDFYYMVQRPHHLTMNFAELEIPTYFLNKPYLFNPPKGTKKIGDFFHLFNQVDIKPYIQNTKPIVYISLPEHIDMVADYNPQLVVFDSLDEPSEEFAIWSRGYHRALRLADIVLATSDRLYKAAARINANTYLIPNACDYNYFYQASTGILNIPGDLKKIKGPVIGYCGAVATWCDLELIDRLAISFPNCSIVMVGPLYNVSHIPLRHNLYWLGLKPYEELAAYMQLFDVGIIPFKLSSMIESVNPIKMWEYMAAGIPVVSTAVSEIEKYQNIVLWSRNNDEFITNIQKALNYDNDEKRQNRMNFARDNSWSTRAKQIIEIIEHTILQKKSSYSEYNHDNPIINSKNQYFQVIPKVHGKQELRHLVKNV